MKDAVIAVVISLLLLAACDNNVNSDKPDIKSKADTYITYSAVGPDISRLLGWQWAKDGTDFKWIFKNDGSVSVIHCCELEFDNQFSYVICGNVMIIIGSEMSATDEIIVVVFTISEIDGVVSLIMDNGIRFTRGDPDNDVFGNPSFQLSNTLLGTWYKDDGTKYDFTTDAVLSIHSAQYGYLARNKGSILLTLGPLIDGQSAMLQQYRYFLNNNQLTLSSSDGISYILTR